MHDLPIPTREGRYVLRRRVDASATTETLVYVVYLCGAWIALGPDGKPVKPGPDDAWRKLGTGNWYRWDAPQLHGDIILDPPA